MKCEKCDYESENNKKVKLGDKEIYLCYICSKFSPSEKEKIENYLKEKVDYKLLETFRKFSKEDKNILGMQEKAREGKITGRAAFGYKLVNKELVADEEKKLTVEDIFRTFLNSDISLNQLAKNYKFSVNGLKKILKNFTYIGKVKFKGQIIQGKHQPIISPELFNKVQNKLENLGIK